VAKQTNVSTSTVSRILHTLNYSCPPLKDAIAIDEFKGNANTGKYQCIIVNPKQHTVMDILPDRTNSHLSAYFKEMERSQRYRVKFFICDMWQPYVDIAQTCFPNAKIVILMLIYNNDLRKAHMLKEWFYEIWQTKQYAIQRVQFYEWIKNAESCGIKEFDLNIKIALHPVIAHDSKNHTPTLDIEPKTKCILP